MRVLVGALVAGSLGAVVALAGGCAQGPEPLGPDDLPVVEVPDLDERALLLLMVDRQIVDPTAVRRAREGGPALREELAVALGRIDRPEVRSPLRDLLLDDEPAVRRAAAFSLGLRGDERSIPALERLLTDPDREVGTLAVEALGRLGAPVGAVADRLFTLPAEEAWHRLLPYLFRFREEGIVHLAEAGLERPEPHLRAHAAYALAREPYPVAAPLLRELLEEPDPWVAGWAARALGGVGGRQDLERLEPLLEHDAPGPVVQALRAAAGLIRAGHAAAPAVWRPRLLEMLEDPRPQVRVATLEVAAAWLLDDEMGEALAIRYVDGEPRERELALLALAEGRDPRARELVHGAAAAAETPVRARAAEAAGRLGEHALLERLAVDSEPLVRIAALQGRLEAGAGEPAALLRAALGDEDPGVRGAALQRLVATPVLSLDDLEATVLPLGPSRVVAVTVYTVRALAARAHAAALERGGVIARLEDELADHPDFLVRREVARALEGLGRPAPDPGPAAAARPVARYREILQRTARPRRLALQTERGTALLELDCPRAPLTCLHFLQLAEQGFYDGLPFHRVIPDFVVQGGDPRGDGWGGPGFTVRDEPSRLRYEAGVLGIALLGPQTGGSQFFITLSPQPHLDGAYTAFGRVVEGRETLARILQGDRIERLRPVR